MGTVSDPGSVQAEFGLERDARQGIVEFAQIEALLLRTRGVLPWTQYPLRLHFIERLAQGDLPGNRLAPPAREEARAGAMLRTSGSRLRRRPGSV